MGPQLGTPGPGACPRQGRAGPGTARGPTASLPPRNRGVRSRPPSSLPRGLGDADGSGRTRVSPRFGRSCAGLIFLSLVRCVARLRAGSARRKAVDPAPQLCVLGELLEEEAGWTSGAGRGAAQSPDPGELQGRRGVAGRTSSQRSERLGVCAERSKGTECTRGWEVEARDQTRGSPRSGTGVEVELRGAGPASRGGRCSARPRTAPPAGSRLLQRGLGFSSGVGLLALHDPGIPRNSAKRA